MNILKLHLPFAHKIYMRIAEPRSVRLLHFGVYLSMFFAGVAVFLETPDNFVGVIGELLANVFGVFLATGGLLSAIAVLPGIWWLERTGIIALWTGLGMYLIILFFLAASPVGFGICTAFILTFILRWIEIKDSSLAPKLV